APQTANEIRPLRFFEGLLVLLNHVEFVQRFGDSAFENKDGAVDRVCNFTCLERAVRHEGKKKLQPTESFIPIADVECIKADEWDLTSYCHVSDLAKGGIQIFDTVKLLHVVFEVLAWCFGIDTFHNLPESETFPAAWWPEDCKREGRLPVLI